MADEFNNKIKVNYTVHPSKSAVLSALPHSFMEYYNSVSYMGSTLDYHDLSIMLDNESIYNICKRNDYDLEYYNADTINRVIAMAASSVTTSKRFKGDKISLTDFV